MASKCLAGHSVFSEVQVTLCVGLGSLRQGRCNEENSEGEEAKCILNFLQGKATLQPAETGITEAIMSGA